VTPIRDLAGACVVVTGASSGVGAAAAAQFAGAGANVVVVGRDPERTKQVASDVGGDALIADFARVADVRSLAESLLAAYPRIDVLACNAGALFRRRRRTVDGFEQTMQVNYLAQWLLVDRLLPLLADSGATVIATSSAAHRIGRLPAGGLERVLRDGPRPYVGMLAYGSSKLAQILHMSELQRRWGDRGVVAAAFHPGVVATRFGSSGGVPGIVVSLPTVRSRMRTPEQAGQDLVRVAVDPTPGRYHVEGAGPARRSQVSRQAVGADLAAGLWETTRAALGR
jgi:NAD(P)-dependent dehydrogenase (short-subunit alcohol dehydrogenase family)